MSAVNRTYENFLRIWDGDGDGDSIIEEQGIQGGRIKSVQRDDLTSLQDKRRLGGSKACTARQSR